MRCVLLCAVLALFSRVNSTPHTADIPSSELLSVDQSVEGETDGLALLDYLRNRVLLTEAENDSRARQRMTEAQLKLEELGEQKQELADEIAQLQEVLRGHADISNTLPRLLAGIDIVHDVVADSGHAGVDVCEGMVATAASHTARLSEQAALLREALSEAGPGSRALELMRGLEERVAEEGGERTQELRELTAVCGQRKRTAASNADKQRITALRSTNQGDITLSSAEVEHAQTDIPRKTVALGLLGDQMERLQQGIREDQATLGQRRAEREWQLRSVDMLRNLFGAAENTEDRALVGSVSGAGGFAETVKATLGSSPETAGFSCQSIKDQCVSCKDGVYWIHFSSGAAMDTVTPHQVYCDMTTDGGGWTYAWSGPAGNVDLHFIQKVIEKRSRFSFDIVQPLGGLSSTLIPQTDQEKIEFIRSELSTSPNTTHDIPFAADAACEGSSPVQTLCRMDRMAECSIFCDFEATCTHWVYAYQPTDEQKYPQLSSAGAMDSELLAPGCCVLLSESICTEPIHKPGFVVGIAQRALDTMTAQEAQDEFSRIETGETPAEVVEGLLPEGSLLQTGSGRLDRTVVSSTALQHYGDRVNQEALKIVALVDSSGNLFHQQTIRLQLNGVRWIDILRASDPCTTLVDRIAVFSGKPTRLHSFAADKSVRHAMGGSSVLRVIPSTGDDTPTVGLANTGDGATCGVEYDYTAPCAADSPLVCDFTALRRLVSTSATGGSDVFSELTADQGDHLISDLFSSHSLYFDTGAVEQDTYRQLFLWGFRSQRCPDEPGHGQCGGKKGFCVEGTCHCVEGWSGPACTTPVCSEPCEHGGQCVAPDRCSCVSPYHGPSCAEKMGCEEPEEERFPNGVMECEGEEVDSVCRYVCNEGMMFSGYGLAKTTVISRVCGADGGWTGSDPVCVPLPCQPLSAPQNGFLSCSGQRPSDACLASCEPGFAFTVGGQSTTSVEIRCAESGWDSSVPECGRVKCPAILPPQHGYGACQGTEFGDVCEFECESGYRSTSFEGVERVCQADGNWSNPNAYCVEE